MSESNLGVRKHNMQSAFGSIPGGCSDVTALRNGSLSPYRRQVATRAAPEVEMTVPVSQSANCESLQISLAMPSMGYP